MIKKEDRRVIKTKRDLKKSLIDLLYKKNFEKITVMDICDNALVNRVTFYHYYEDKVHLLDDTIKTFEDELLQKVTLKPSHTMEGAIDYCADLFLIVIDECVANSTLINALANQHNEIVDRLIASVTHEFILDFLKSIQKYRKFKYPVQIISTFVEGGFTQTIFYWLNHQDCYSKENLTIGVKEIIKGIAYNNILFAEK